MRERFQRSVSCIGGKRRIREKMCIVVQEACALRKNMPVYEYEQTSTECNERVQKGEICELIKEKVVRKRGDVHE